MKRMMRDATVYVRAPYGKLNMTVSLPVDQRMKEMESQLRSVPGFDFNQFARDVLSQAMESALSSFQARGVAAQ